MAVPPPNTGVATADNFVNVMSTDEWKTNARGALKRLGLTYEELEAQAGERNFVSTAARKLWVLIGGTL